MNNRRIRTASTTSALQQTQIPSSGLRNGVETWDGTEDLMQLHSLEHIRTSLEEDQRNALDIVTVLERHQAFLQDSVNTILDAGAKVELKQFHLDRLLHLLNMHAKAQEETLYRHLIASDAADARQAGFAGRFESQLIFQVGYELYSMNFHSAWTEEIEAKSGILLRLVQNRIRENNETVFETAEKRLDPVELEYLAHEYLKKCLNYLDDELNVPQISLFESSFATH
jgi:hypothetical protein